MGGMEHIYSGNNTIGGRSSARYIEITCSTCGSRAMKRSDFVDTVKREGRKIVCSRLCAVPHRKPSTYVPISLQEYSGNNKTSVCKLCKENLPIKEFIKKADNKHKKFRKSWFCSNCRPLRIREYHLKGQYNMKGIDEYHQMLKTQNEKCAICDKLMDRPCIDHNHETGKVRELLCVQCNSMIGNAKESTATLYSAVRYLEKHV